MKRVAKICVAIVCALLVAGGCWLWTVNRVPDYHVGLHMAAPASHAVQVGWSQPAADKGATQFSPAGQITPANVAGLKVAWVYRTGDPLEKSSFQDTPTLVAGSLMVCSVRQRIMALDPTTGAERWRFDPHVKQELAGAAKWTCRGIAEWHDPAAAAGAPCAERLLLATLDRRLIAIDARNGRRCKDFGRDGEIRIAAERPLINDSELQFDSPPAVANGVVVIGSRVHDGSRIWNLKGTVRAFDARTGRPRWTFDAIPAGPQDLQWASWHRGIDPVKPIEVGGGNVWADMAVDEARDLIFLPTTSPSIDFWGGDRPGNDDYADSLVAIRGATGKVVWHYQIVHHNLYDMDLPTAPILTDLTVKGRTIPVAIQLTKMGMIYVFDRRDGKPVFPIVERPVPRSKLPGEWTSPTQPMPATMPSLMPTDGMPPNKAWGFTPWDKGRCKAEIERAGGHGLFEPPSLAGAIVYPGYMGGVNMGHRAWDPVRKLLIANVTRIPMKLKLKPRGDAKASPGDDGPLPPFIVDEQGYLLSPLGAPCSAPPWGALVALDLEKQKIIWEKPLGTIEKLGPIPVPLKLGTPSRGGPALTAGGLAFIGGTMDDRFRAFDTANGRELWNVKLPAGGQATPMTYVAGGRQYVVIAAGGHSWMQTTPGDYVIAFALPK